MQPRGTTYVLACLAASAAALLSAPIALPESYSWVAHTTSEAAGQGVPGAWIARLGFVLLGTGVLIASWHARAIWGVPAAVLHALFGIFMIGAAAFASRPWEVDLPYDVTEDVLHSVAASAMGPAFALGVATVAVRRMRRRRRRMPEALDIIAVAASVLIPLSMFTVGGAAGLLQRIMFGIAYSWYGREALRLHRAGDPTGIRVA